MRMQYTVSCCLQYLHFAIIGFYEKNGFIRVKRKPSYYLSGVDAFKLKKKL